MPKLTVQVRTHDNLLELLAAGASPAWRVAEDRAQSLTHIHIINFDGTQRIEGVFDRDASERREDGDLVLRFLDGHIVNCRVKFVGQNPVHFLED